MMREETKEIIGDRLRTLRNRKGWTAKQAAAAASEITGTNISPGRWQNWECASRAPSLELFPYLAKTLDTTPEFLAGWKTDPGIGVETNKYILANLEPGGSDDEIAFNVEALKRRGLHQHKLMLVEAGDEAMSKHFSRGDLVLVDRSDNKITGAGVYALESDNSIFLRYVRKEPDGGFVVYADDEKHAPARAYTTEDFDKLKVIGRYVLHAHWATRI
ncbi:LexA family transcriptional regulator [Vibrio fluvialis]|uniref:XRE family transcriptional regulator n=1 Tax=Vibrio fluvialis TaxID=676 RepID=UPI001EEB9AA1|nr:LexA family transcriptional regulator [Vibrio fluvialis]MCG6410475.1 LexA family transcriptional regulator [Vibrio fluvialis]